MPGIGPLGRSPFVRYKETGTIGGAAGVLLLFLEDGMGGSCGGAGGEGVHDLGGTAVERN
jgi:hypothetical protein